MTSPLMLTGYNDRGLVRIAGEVPNGILTVTRESAGEAPYVLRGGYRIPITTEGFVLEDSESPLDTELTYTASVTADSRIIQRNLVLTPDFTRGIGSWTAGSARTLAAVGGIGYISNNTGGSGLSGQTIGEVAIGSLLPNTTYLVYGTLKFTTPDVYTWLDVRNIGTWQQVRTAKGTWQQVLSTAPVVGGGIYTQVLVSLSSGVANIGDTVMALNVQMQRANEWFTFAAYLTTPAIVPANARLRIMHGTTDWEKSIAWQLDKFAMQLKSVVDLDYRLLWFSGDTPTPDRPVDFFVSNPNWADTSFDAGIKWEGSPGNSVSQFSGPSRISASAKITLNQPDLSKVCGPVLLSDPVSSALAMWFGLAEVSDLDYDANMTLMKVLNRSDYIASSTARSGPQGTLTLITNTLEERELALRLLRSGRVMYLRNSDSSYPENNWYIAIGTVTEMRMLPDARRPERLWAIPYTRVERPSGVIEASTGVTWKMILETGMTWEELRSAREDWLDVLVTTP